MLEILNVSKKYKKQQALSNVSFSISEGMICGLLGLNGAGKSTLMKIIASLTHKDKGKVLLNGNTIDGNVSIGYMIESPCFYPDLSGYNNLLILSKLYNDVSKERVDEVLTLVGLSDAKKKLFGNYSLGMKQRLYFAYAMMNKPSILILDEPFNGIDPVTSRFFKNLIVSLKNQGCTILVSSHVISDIEEICDKVVILDKGLLVYDSLVKEDVKLEDIFLSHVSLDGSAQ